MDRAVPPWQTIPNLPAKKAALEGRQGLSEMWQRGNGHFSCNAVNVG